MAPFVVGMEFLPLKQEIPCKYIDVRNKTDNKPSYHPLLSESDTGAEDKS